MKGPFAAAHTNQTCTKTGKKKLPQTFINRLVNYPNTHQVLLHMICDFRINIDHTLHPSTILELVISFT